jgi:uncharacterized membrane protein YiaA
MKKSFYDLLLSTFVTLIKQYPQTVWDLSMISAARGYLKTILILRRFSISLIQAAFSLFLLIGGFFIINIGLFLALFLLAPWGNGIKVLIIFLIGILEICGSLLGFRCLLSEKKWMKKAKQNAFVNKVVQKYYPLGLS